MINIAFSKAFPICLIIMGLVTMSCGVHQESVLIEQHTPAQNTDTLTLYIPVPVGVDSTTAIEAYQLAERGFVTLDEDSIASSLFQQGKDLQIEVDTFWQVYDKALKAKTVSDTTALQLALEALDLFEKTDYLYPQNPTITHEDLAKISSRKYRKLESNYEKARELVERAILIDPFNEEYKVFLAELYLRLAKLHRSRNELMRTIQLYQNLIHLNKGAYWYYGKMAEVYEDLDDYHNAYINYMIAEDIMLETWPFESKDPNAFKSPVYKLTDFDLKTFAYFINSQAYMEEKLWRVENALADFKRVREILENTDDTLMQNHVTDEITYLEWDYGDIASHEKWMKFHEIRETDEFQAAMILMDLLPSLDSPKVKKEAEFHMATLEWKTLNEKEKAIGRLYKIIETIRLDSTGAALDTTDAEMINNYGIMCFSMGKDLESKNRLKSLQYYLKSTKYEWEHRGSSLISCMNALQNQPEQVIELGEYAFKYKDRLTEKEQTWLYQFMIDAYKRIGKFDQARIYYSLWKEVKHKGTE